VYLSRLILNPLNRQVQSDLAYPSGLHRTLLRAFPDALVNDQERLLFRVESGARHAAPQILAQSQLLPAWESLPSGYLAASDEKTNPAVKPLRIELHSGQILAFRLLANPTKRLSRSLSRNMDKSKRVGLYTLDEQLAWLARKGEAHGFRVLSAAATRQERVDDARRDLKFLSVQFDGVLQVVDPARLAEAVAAGIGSGKAFGFGLLSLAPAR